MRSKNRRICGYIGIYAHKEGLIAHMRPHYPHIGKVRGNSILLDASSAGGDEVELH